MTDREAMQQALDALEEPHEHIFRHRRLEAIVALKKRLAQPEPVIDKSAARRIATALGWVPPSDTSTERVAEEAKQRREQEPVSLNDGRLTRYPDGSIGVGTPQQPVAKWDASAPLVVTPHPSFQATLQPSKPWVGLTEEEINACDPQEECWNLLEVARAIEAKLRERNQ